MTEPSSPTTASLSRTSPSARRVKSGTGAPATDRMAPGLAVALAVDGEPRAAGVQRRDHHLVQRQRAGLVGVDRARGPERLDVGEVLHDRLGVGELLGAHRQQAGDEGRHAGGDRGDRHRGAEQQEVLDRHPPDQPGHDDDGDGPPRDDPEHLRQRVQLALQRRAGARHRGEHRRDLAHLRLHPGRSDEEGGRAAGHGGVLEEHVRPVAEGHVVGRQHAGILGDRGALPRERRLLRLEGRGAQDPAVSRHDVAGLELDDVAGHELGRVG